MGTKRVVPVEDKAKFFAAIASGQNIQQACRIAGIHYNTGGKWLKKVGTGGMPRLTGGGYMYIVWGCIHSWWLFGHVGWCGDLCVVRFGLAGAGLYCFPLRCRCHLKKKNSKKEKANHRPGLFGFWLLFALEGNRAQRGRQPLEERNRQTDC